MGDRKKKKNKSRHLSFLSLSYLLFQTTDDLRLDIKFVLSLYLRTNDAEMNLILKYFLKNYYHSFYFLIAQEIVSAIWMEWNCVQQKEKRKKKKEKKRRREEEKIRKKKRERKEESIEPKFLSAFHKCFHKCLQNNKTKHRQLFTYSIFHEVSTWLHLCANLVEHRCVPDRERRKQERERERESKEAEKEKAERKKKE